MRGALSRPVQHAVDTRLIEPGDTIFDYGCGYGEDVEGLNGLGYPASGWDPHSRPDEPKVESDVVNIGYVVNVVADSSERREVLTDAWRLTRRVLIVSARLNNELRNVTRGRPLGDGYITGHGTFQRFYSQAELRAWIDSTLEAESVALAPGVFAIFRSDEDANEYVLRNRRRRATAVRVSRTDRLYDENRDAIDELLAFFMNRGRLPTASELPELQTQLRSGIGSTKKAWTIARAVTDDTDWEAIAAERHADLLVDLALLKLNRRPNFGSLPPSTQADVKALAGSYKAATADADALLFSAGDVDTLSAAADQAETGKRLPTALYLHEACLETLPPVLRVYEGCARWLVGSVDGANIVKLATDQAKVSYLEYPDFDRDPHPRLRQTTYVRLPTLDVDTRDYSASDNPPILHRKEQFVDREYPEAIKFARLTAQEERFGLFETDTRAIGTVDGWQTRLVDCGVALRGHRVVRSQV